MSAATAPGMTEVAQTRVVKDTYCDSLRLLVARSPTTPSAVTPGSDDALPPGVVATRGSAARDRRRRST